MAVEGQSEEGIAVKLAEWQQGDFALECGEFWFRDIEGPIEGTEELSDFGIDPDVLGFVVITQTCDIVRAPQVVPCVTICPIVKVGDDKLKELEKGISPRTSFIANAPDGAVADLSRSMSISKELLITWERQRGCTNTGEQLEFARSLEGVYGRFAYPDDFIRSVGRFRRKVVDTYAKENSELGKAFRSIREIRIFPHADWSNPDSVPITFIAVLDEPEDRELKDRSGIIDILEAKIDSIDWEGRFSLHEDKVIAGTLADLRAIDYVNSFPLDLNSLSFARRFQE